MCNLKMWYQWANFRLSRRGYWNGKIQWGYFVVFCFGREGVLNRLILWLFCLSKWVLVAQSQSCPTLWEPRDYSPSGSSVHGDSPGKNTGVGSLSLLQGIFLTQGLIPGLPHWRQILDYLSHQGSPRLSSIFFLFLISTKLPKNLLPFCLFLLRKLSYRDTHPPI